MALMTKEQLANWISGTEENSAGGIAQKWTERGLTRSKARRFYHEVKRLERIWKNSGRDTAKFRDLLPEIKILIAKISYDKNRQGGNSLPREVAEWFTDEIRAINDPASFEQFVVKLEAVMGMANLRDGSLRGGEGRWNGGRGGFASQRSHHQERRQ